MKNLIPTILILLIVSCKTKAPTIVTSKEKAIKSNQYIDRSEIRKPAKKVENITTEISPKKSSIKTQPIAINEPIDLEKSEDGLVLLSTEATYMRDQMIWNAESNLGCKYRTGGTTREGFDCSGLMYATFKKFNITLPRTSTDMAKKGRVIERHEAQSGDLIFFKTNGKTHINHVGMIVRVTDDEIIFVHSSTSKGVIHSSTKESYYGKTFAQINRIIE